MINSYSKPNSCSAYIDVAKGIGIILVVLGHTYGIPAELLDIIYSFHMPLFFIISGYVYNWNKYNSFGFGKIVSDRAKRYLIPFYYFAGINLALTLAFNFVFRHTPITFSTIKTYVLGTLYCYADMNHMPNCSPIWFFMTLFIGGIIFWAIMKYSKKTRPIWMIMLLTTIYLLYLFVDFRLPLNLAPTGAAVFFMYVGYLIKRYDPLNHTWLIALIVVGVFASHLNETTVGMNENTYGTLLFFLIASICISIPVLILSKLFSNYKNPVCKFLKWLGSNTVPVVAFNYFMRDLSTEVYYLIPYIRNCPIHWISSFILTLSGCLIIILIWNFVKAQFKSQKA